MDEITVSREEILNSDFYKFGSELSYDLVGLIIDKLNEKFTNIPLTTKDILVMTSCLIGSIISCVPAALECTIEAVNDPLYKDAMEKFLVIFNDKVDGLNLRLFPDIH